ncbi:MAG: DUF4827 family protein [Paludibacteraceae bacterium]|nr:DUF4827 family protein [Paludibacteraceae bacterium]
MKSFLKLFLTLIVLLSIIVSCDDNVTYAEQLRAEKELIADYIKRDSIIVITELPHDSVFPWPKNTYYLSSTGMYFRLEERGEYADTLAVSSGNRINPRYHQYTLTQKPDTVSDWNTIDFAYPSSFYYNDLTQACKAWHEAVSYMKYNNSIARIIVPSKMGFEADVNSVTPYGYLFKIKFQK